MSDESALEISTWMQILRQRLFVSHDSKSQRSITSEYTIRSKRDELTNVILISKNVLPNLLVIDNQDNILPVLPTKLVKRLLKSFLKDSEKFQKQKLEFLISEIDGGNLHLIWIKIPKSNALKENEVKTIRLNYSPKYNSRPDSKLRLKIKKRNYPLYYTLFTPNEFDFDRTKYPILSEDGVTPSATLPDGVETIRTHNSNIFRIPSGSKDNFAIPYSFKPSSEATFSTKVGAIALGLLVLAVWCVKIMDWWGVDLGAGMVLIENQIQIALFVIGGSLLLLQLNSNHAIRWAQRWWYIVPALLGGTILI